MDKKKTAVKRILASVLFLAILAGVLYYVMFVTKRKNSDEKYADFFAQEQDFDVLFFGSSRVLNGVYPMELWDDYGFVSYNFGGHGNFIPVSYWVWKNAMDYTKPKLVVIDTYYIEQDYPYRENIQQMHLSTDAFPISKTKIAMVDDLFGSEDSDFHENRNEFLFNFGTYHDRWKDLTKGDFIVGSTPEKGAEMRIDVASGVHADLLHREEREGVEGWTDDSLAKMYLRQWIKECKDEGIEVLLVYLPHAANRQEELRSIGTQQLADEMEVDYVNLLYEEIINYNVDFYDQDGHLNPTGAVKVTDYLGDYIEKHYDIPNRRRSEEYSKWWDDYEKYKEYKISLLREQKYLETYLMLCCDSDFDVEIQINDASTLLEDKRVAELIEALQINPEVAYNANDVEYVTDDTWDYDMRIVVKYAGTEDPVDEARFTVDSGIKPPDEGLDNVVFYANSAYKRYGM